MSEHTLQTPAKLPDKIRNDQVLAQLYDMKESIVMSQLVVKRVQDEVKKQLTKINNMIEMMEGGSK